MLLHNWLLLLGDGLGSLVFLNFAWLQVRWCFPMTGVKLVQIDDVASCRILLLSLLQVVLGFRVGGRHKLRLVHTFTLLLHHEDQLLIR